MIIRLHVDAPLQEGAMVALDADQVHYLRHVMRRNAGDEIHLFNGRDGEYAAEIARLDKKAGAASLRQQTRAPEHEPDLWLLFAPVKRAPMEMMMQKATELGVALFAPVMTGRAQAARLNETRLAAIAREAAEQCGRLSVPTINALQKLPDALAGWPDNRPLIFCDEAGDDAARLWGGREGRAVPMLEALVGKKPAGAPADEPADEPVDEPVDENAQTNMMGKAAILIGPEGGFTPDERAFLRQQEFVVPVTLGPRILRADTAAIAAIALWQAACGDLRRR